jgi:hypothetical protein
MEMGDAAASVAEQLWKNVDALKKYGQSVVKTDAAQQAYYSAMATNAQQLADLSGFQEAEIA